MNKKHLFASMGLLMSLSFASLATPVGGVCIGGSNTMSDSTGLASGGVWSSSNPAIATINASTGTTLGIMAGTVNMTYTSGGSFVVYPYTVSPPPAAIAGPTDVCVGSSITLTNATPGGTWSSESYSGYAAINPATGVLTGYAAGNTNVHYTIGPGCSADVMETVISTTPDYIMGDTMVCSGFTGALTDATAGGTWSSSNAAIATIDATGIVTGVATGTAIITYTTTNSCGTGYRTYPIEVSSTTTMPAAIVAGATTVDVGSWLYVSDTVGGGVWSSSDTTIATITTYGAITGISAGTVTISYTINGCSGPVSATIVVTVNPANCISGNVNFTSAPYYGNVKVWLIKYDAVTHLLTAADSTLTYAYGTTAAYQFCGVAGDTYRVKAAAADSSISMSGYLPTYHTASYYWNTATTFVHAFGTVDAGKDINMGSGTPTSGPGFIAGDVTTGANKGTSGSIPSVGLLIYAQNSVTGAILQQTITDASGHYSFSNLPAGVYNIYPELINYATTPYAAITLTSAAPSMTAASFIQHTVSYTITPGTTGVGNVTSASSFISTFPNPTSGKLNVNYEIASTEQATLTVTDITGRAIYTNDIELTKGAGSTAIDLSAISNGLYIISIKSASVNYTNKIQLQK